MGRGDRVLPTHKSDGTHPLYVHHNAVKLIEEGGGFSIAYDLFAAARAKHEGMPSWIAFEIKIKKRDQTGVSQLERVLAGEWGYGTAQLVKSKRSGGSKYLMRMTVQYEPDPFKTLVPGNIMGIDLGLSTPACIHVRVDGAAQKWAMLIGNGRTMLNARGIVRGDMFGCLDPQTQGQPAARLIS